MATVTLILRLRRIEGRSPVDPADLADALAEEVETLLGDTEINVVDLAGDDATYEVTATRATIPGEAPPVNNAWPETECNQCGAPIQSDRHGRPRLYCSDACRQRASRARR